MSGLPSRKKRRFVIVSSSCRRVAPGPISTAAIGAESSTRYACEREPATSERSRRSTSIAADASEYTMPSPPQVGHFFVISSRGPSVTFELRAQRLFDCGPVLRVRHVDEVDDDDAADVAQAQLAHDLFHGLEIVLRDRVLEARAGVLPARADEAAGVHVDDGERLRVV